MLTESPVSRLLNQFYQKNDVGGCASQLGPP